MTAQQRKTETGVTDPATDDSWKVSEEEWSTVEVAPIPTRVILDKVGDSFTGVYQGMEHKPFSVHIFTDKNGDRFSIGDSLDLARMLEKVRRGTMTRITLRGFERMENGDKKVYEVQTRR